MLLGAGTADPGGGREAPAGLRGVSARCPDSARPRPPRESGEGQSPAGLLPNGGARRRERYLFSPIGRERGAGLTKLPSRGAEFDTTIG